MYYEISAKLIKNYDSGYNKSLNDINLTLWPLKNLTFSSIG